MPTPPRLYTDLASLWRLFSPPEEYAEEVETFRARFRRHGVPDGATVLHLGSGGGSVDYHLRQSYRVTGVDVSEAMIAEARRVNPAVEYVRGDIRTVRLGRTFDAVLVHDAISYMTSVDELRAVYRTAAAHLRVGGVMVALPEELKERLPHLAATAETRVSGNTVLTVLETHHVPDPLAHAFENVYVFLVREGDELRVELDRHVVGAFELEEFLGAMRAAGFAPNAERWELSEWGDGPELPLVTAVRVE
jgi:ubiquinone/menaquinone biosynthesis C-methylase UbiE